MSSIKSLPEEQLNPKNAEVGQIDGTTRGADPDDTLDHDTSGDNPYPGSDAREWTSRFAEALATQTGLPPEVAEGIAPFVVRPKRYVQIGRKGMPDTLRLDALSENAIGQSILTVEVHGFAGNPGEYNERIRRAFDSPVKPGANPDRVLPTLVTGAEPGGNLAPYITTAQPVSHDRVNKLLGTMGQALDEANGARGYRLDEDIQVYGQQEPTLHVPLLRQISEPDGAGGTRIRQVVDLTAVKGANRSRARLKLFGLVPEDIVFGVDPAQVMGLPEATKSADPRVWVPALADLLKAGYADREQDKNGIAHNAMKIATVKLQIIVGSPELAEFHNATFDPNRVDHRRPPLDYVTAEKASSDMRALLRDCKSRGTITEAQRLWLAGEGPDPEAVPGESRVDARDRRDQALLDIVLPPKDPAARSDAKRIRIVLGEPSRTLTGRRHVEHRTRMFSAVASDGYTNRWNPRVLDGLFTAATIKDQLSYAGSGTWDELLTAAEAGDPAKLEVFINTRGMHWLAEHGIVEADRGSVGAQKSTYADSDDAEEALEAKRVRRGMTNVRNAMLKEPTRAVAVFRELAHATNTDSAPRTVDSTGEPLDGTVMTRDWLNIQFPKVNGTRLRRTTPPPPDGPPPVQPEMSPQQKLVQVRDDFVTAVADELMDALAEACEHGIALIAAAREAQQHPLPDTLAETIESLEKALTAGKRDVVTITAAVSSLKHDSATAEDFASMAAEFIAANADDMDADDMDVE